jgi:hypothetical protein
VDPIDTGLGLTQGAPHELSPIAIMMMIVAAVIVIVATVAITVIVAVVAIRVSVIGTPMYTPIMPIVGLRLVHGQ